MISVTDEWLSLDSVWHIGEIQFIFFQKKLNLISVFFIFIGVILPCPLLCSLSRLQCQRRSCWRTMQQLSRTTIQRQLPLFLLPSRSGGKEQEINACWKSTDEFIFGMKKEENINLIIQKEEDERKKKRKKAFVLAFKKVVVKNCSSKSSMWPWTYVHE